MLVASVCVCRGALELSHVLGSKPSTRRSTPSKRPHGSGRRCRPAPVAPVDSVDPPPRSGPHRRPAGRHCRPHRTARVDSVDRPSCSDRRRRPATVIGSTLSTRPPTLPMVGGDWGTHCWGRRVGPGNLLLRRNMCYPMPDARLTRDQV